MSASLGAEHYAVAHSEHRTQENRDRLVFASEPVIRSIISKIRVPGDDLAHPDELFQVGVIAVLQALDAYNPETGVQFITFAYPRIRGEIVDYLRRLDPLPRRRRAKVARAREAFDSLSQVIGGTPCESQIAGQMGVGIAELRIIESDANRRHMSYLYDAYSDEDEGLRLVDTVADQNALDQFDAMDWDDIYQYLDLLSAELSQRDRTIIELNYGEDLTLSEIGQLLGISEARVSQLRKSILSRMASKIEPTLRTAA